MTTASTPQGPGDSSITKLTMMSIADVRSFVTSELSRIKDEISALYEKFNTLKDTHTSDKMALITQLNQEFAKINARMNDFSLAMQKVVGDSEHGDEHMTTKLQGIMSELDRKMLQFKIDMGVLDPRSDMSGLKAHFEDFKTSVESAFTSLRAELAATNTKIDKLSATSSDTKDKLSELSWKVALIIAIALWIINTFAGDAIKGAVGNLLKTKPAVTIQAPETQQIRHAVDTVQRSGN